MIGLMEIASQWWAPDKHQLSSPVFDSVDNSEVYDALGLQHECQPYLCVITGQKRWVEFYQ